jgi:hypothetical protein
VSTNDLGEFRFAGIVPGKYYLCATYHNRQMVQAGADSVMEDYVPTFYPGAADVSAAAPLEVGPGDQTQGIDIRLTRIHTVSVKGRVMNYAQSQTPPGGRGAGSPASYTTLVNGQAAEMVVNTRAGFLVFIQPRNSLNPANIRASVRPDGTFEFPSVAPGAYDLVATTDQGGMGHYTRQALDVGNADIEGIGLTINPGVAVTGHVRFDGDAPQPLAGLNVRLVPRVILPVATVPPPARVDPDGGFRFDDVNPTLHDVTMQPPPGCYVKSIRSGNTDVLVSGLDLGNGAGSLDILLGTNPPQVGGSVQNSATGQPAPAVTVVLIPQEKERQGRSFFYFSVATDRFGNFSFSRVIPGEYRLYAWEDVPTNAWYDPDFMKAYDGQGETVGAREGSQANVKLIMIPAR